MSSAPSLKDVTKAVGAFVPAASLPLPDDLVEILDGYLRKHEKFDDSVADKLNEELLAIYQKDIVGVPARYAAFLNILRRLRPLIGQPEKVVKWWELFLPAFDHLNQEKDLATESQGTVLDILTADETSEANSATAGASTALARKILASWMEQCVISGTSEDPNQNFKEKQLRETLIIYGKKREFIKEFLDMLASSMVEREERMKCLHLLADFVRRQPPHLHQILHTSLFGTLINCLQLDTSTTVASLALTVLNMILPYMPSSLVPHLPALFNVYARLLFWERELSTTQPDADMVAESTVTASGSAWQKKKYEPGFDDNKIPHLLNYFTILYGLYPLNFTDYIRKPQRYLRHADVPIADDIEFQPSEIRQASERFRQCHLLHENFYTLTIDSEKTDFGRWIKSEPAEVVADCMALRLPSEADAHQGPSYLGIETVTSLSARDDAAAEGHDPVLLSRSSSGLFGATQGESWRNAQQIALESPPASRAPSAAFRHSSQSSQQSHQNSSTRNLGNDIDSRTGSAQPPSSGPHTPLQDVINSNKVVRSDLDQSLNNDGGSSHAASNHEAMPERFTSWAQPDIPPGNTPTAISDKRKDARILLLLNELTFERYLKQQHLTHMGELRRRQVREAASEAEAQNLIMANRNLRLRLEEAKKTELQVKKDSEKSRALAKKWEADLSGKLRALRIEQKKWLTEGEALRRELEAARDAAEGTRILLCEAEVRELSFAQGMKAMEADSAELERLKEECKGLTLSLRDLQAKETLDRNYEAQAAEADAKSAVLEMKLSSKESELQETHGIYQSQVAELNAKLQEALMSGKERKANAMKDCLEGALAVSRNQQAELENRIMALGKKNSELAATVLELQSSARCDRPRPVSPENGISLVPSNDSESFQSREYRGHSDPDYLEGTSHDPTLSLDPSNTTSFGSQTRRPSTPPGAEVSSTRSSPAKHLGRDRKDKSEDKREKKSGGIRGIRGFV